MTPLDPGSIYPRDHMKCWTIYDRRAFGFRWPDGIEAIVAVDIIVPFSDTPIRHPGVWVFPSVEAAWAALEATDPNLVPFPRADDDQPEMIESWL